MVLGASLWKASRCVGRCDRSRLAALRCVRRLSGPKRATGFDLVTSVGMWRRPLCGVGSPPPRNPALSGCSAPHMRM